MNSRTEWVTPSAARKGAVEYTERIRFVADDVGLDIDVTRVQTRSYLDGGECLWRSVAWVADPDRAVDLADALRDYASDTGTGAPFVIYQARDHRTETPVGLIVFWQDPAIAGIRPDSGGPVL